MTLSNIVRTAFLGGALAFGGCAAERAASVRELHQQGRPYSITEVLQAYHGEILPLYRSDDPEVQFMNFTNNREGIFRLMETYLSEIDEQTVSSATPEQKQALSVAYSDYSVAIVMGNGRENISEALPIMERAIELDSHNPAFYYQYAQLLVNTGRFSDALRALDSCVALEPSNQMVRGDRERLEQYIRDHP